MTTKKTQRHWLEKATPKYWQPRQIWRVRAVKEGKPFQWILKNGRGQAGSTGAALAQSEWARIASDIIAKEQGQARVEAVADDPMITFATKADEQKFHQANAERFAWRSSKFADVMEFDEWKLWNEFLRQRAAQGFAVSSNQTVGNVTTFGDIVDLWKQHLGWRFKQTKKDIHTSDDLGLKRYDEYKRTLEHCKTKVGGTIAERCGDFLISEPVYSEILQTYKDACRAEMDKGKNGKPFTASWFNERMKTMRTMTSWLLEKRYLPSLPPNIIKLTEKYRSNAKSKPMPKEIVQLHYKLADELFRSFILLACNCGFRQAEISLLEREHIKVISGVHCIEKLRGKTGVPIAIPLWPATLDAIERTANKQGLLFTTRNGRPMNYGNTDSIYQMLITLRARDNSGKLADYSFENFRDTGATFLDSQNPILTPLYLGNGDTRMAKFYVGKMDIEASIPQNLTQALNAFERYLDLK